MFKYLIYLVSRRNLYDFDPGTDLLVSPQACLKWRHVDQDVPMDGKPYGGAIRMGGSWIILRFNPKLSYPGVEEWLETNRARAGRGNLGMHVRSRYTGLLMPLSQEVPITDLHARVEEINRYLEENWPGQVPWRVEKQPHNPREEWRNLREYFVDTLLDYSLAA